MCVCVHGVRVMRSVSPLVDHYPLPRLRRAGLKQPVTAQLVCASDWPALTSFIVQRSPLPNVKVGRIVFFPRLRSTVCLQPVNSQPVGVCDWLEELVGRPSASFPLR